MPETFESLQTDCVIVGGGAAGLRAAVECLEGGVKTLLVMKSVVGQSHSLMAEGGVNAAIGQNDPTDDWRIHFDDTLRAGRFINCKPLVEQLCRDSPQRMYDLLRYGAGFATDAEGKIVQLGHSGGQTKNRVITQGDFIGFIIQRALMSRALRLGLTVVDDTVCVKILSDDDGEGAAVLAYNLKRSTFLAIEARSIILAAGGAGRLFDVTTNPMETTGEVYVLGLDAGIELRDMEMVQFHPTALCWPHSARGILVTEAARGAGGELYNANGERFMERYDPRLELAPRDVVTRAIVQEIAAGRGTANGGVFLDVTRMPAEFLLEILGNTARVIKAYQGLDITRERIEVRPAAHHFMGGLVPDDMQTMEALPGIFVAGEIGWGVHGANRLGGNSLAETQVSGARAGRGACLRRQSLTGESAPLAKAKIADELTRIEKIFSSTCRAQTTVYSIRRRLGECMERYAGLSRSAESLQHACKQIEMLTGEFGRCRKRLDNYHSFAHIFECSAMLRLAGIVTRSALSRTESRGAHFREDWPLESTDLYNTAIDARDATRVEKRSVQ